MMQAMCGFRHDMIGSSAPLLKVIRQAAAAAQHDSTVLITGETGTGKELVAEAIHSNSKRAGGPLVALNCAAIPESLFESELFGYEKGAFTGALNPRRGDIERAAGGTLLLDEVGELTPMAQAKLLRVLQEREIKRLGGTRSVRANVRILAATNRDLRENFRPDLYYRLHVVSIPTPTLRERRQDILALARHFVLIHAPQADRRIDGISAAAETLLEHYHWPGNVRQLQNLIERAVLMGSTNTIEPEDLPDLVGPAGRDFKSGLAAAKRNLLERAFALANGHLDTAAALLRLNRQYVCTLLKKLDLLHLRGKVIDRQG